MLFTAHLQDLVQSAAREAGFDQVGVAPVSDFPELDYFRRWIAEGRGGEMHYLEAREPGGELKRAAVQRLFPWARSVIVGALNYHSGPPFYASGHGQDTLQPPNAKQTAAPGPAFTAGRGWISRYAWPQRDYHDEVLDRLKGIEQCLREAGGSAVQTRRYVDTGPLVERVYAFHAGIGWWGKNTCIINQRLGSWLFLGIILTSLELIEAFAAPAPDRCGTCTRCLDACPTQAFLGPRQLDAARCISYLTIEKRGPIPEELRAGIGRHVFGCDICQEVCPWNRKAPVGGSPALHPSKPEAGLPGTLHPSKPKAGLPGTLQPRPELVNPDLEWLATMDEREFRNVFRGSPIPRAKRSGIRRNAVVAMGNSGDAKFLPLLRRLTSDPDPVVAEHAAWALQVVSRQS
jgi:epoxyqueuosine reductase